MWMIWYLEHGKEPEIFDGPDAQFAARETYLIRKNNWNCVLLSEIERG